MASRLFEYIKNIKGDNIILLFADGYLFKKIFKLFYKKTENIKRLFISAATSLKILANMTFHVKCYKLANYK